MEFILIHRNHRQNNSSLPEYESFKQYCKRLEEEYDLYYTPLNLFKKQSFLWRCFEIKNKIKGLEFAFKYSDYVQKPEKE